MYGFGNCDIDTTGFDLMFKYNNPYFRMPFTGMMPGMMPYGARFNTGVLGNDVLLKGMNKPKESNAKYWAFGGLIALLGLGAYGLKRGFAPLANFLSKSKEQAANLLNRSKNPAASMTPNIPTAGNLPAPLVDEVVKPQAAAPLIKSMERPVEEAGEVIAQAAEATAVKGSNLDIVSEITPTITTASDTAKTQSVVQDAMAWGADKVKNAGSYLKQNAPTWENNLLQWGKGLINKPPQT